MIWNYLCEAPEFTKSHPCRFSPQTSMGLTLWTWLEHNPVHAKFLLMQIHWRSETQRNNTLHEITYFPYTILHLLLFLPNETVPLYPSSSVLSSRPLLNIHSLLKYQYFHFSRPESLLSLWQFGHLKVVVFFLMEQDIPWEKRKSKPAAPRSAVPKTMHTHITSTSPNCLQRNSSVGPMGCQKHHLLQDLHSYRQEIGHYL